MEPVTFSSGEVAYYYSRRLPDIRQSRTKQWRGRCPLHHGRNNNFAIDPKTGCWYCHSLCGRGGSLLDLEMALTGAPYRQALESVCSLIGRVLQPQSRRDRRL